MIQDVQSPNIFESSIYSDLTIEKDKIDYIDEQESINEVN